MKKYLIGDIARLCFNHRTKQSGRELADLSTETSVRRFYIPVHSVRYGAIFQCSMIKKMTENIPQNRT